MARLQRRADLEVKITQAHRDSHGTYGSPRITAEPRDQGEVVTAKTVANIMAGVGTEGISPRTFKVETTGDGVATSGVDLGSEPFGRVGLGPVVDGHRCPVDCEPSHDRRADSA